MTDLAVTEALYPTRDEIRAQILSDIRYEASNAGLTANVKRGSDNWFRATAFANRMALVVANNQVTAKNISPYRATDDDLIELAGAFGVSKRSASKATGYATISLTFADIASVNIPAGKRCTAPDGIVYETTQAYTAATNGSKVQLEAVEAGAGGDQDAGTILTWDSGDVAYLADTLTVDSAGLDGGRDIDSEEVLRQRLLRRLSFPMVGGNWSYVANLAEEASASVDIAYVYMSARGPASYDVAVQGDTDNPVLTSALQDTVNTAILADMPGTANLNVTSIAEEDLDIIIDLELPLPASVGGVGGGWSDADPWPSDADSAGAAKVTNVDTANNQITVSSTSADPPVVGHRFGIWIPADEEFAEFTVTAVTGSSGAYVITVDTAQSAKLTKVTTDMYVTAWAANMQTYGTLFLAAMQTIGAGEKSSNDDILKWARRRPGPDVERPYKLTNLQLFSLTSQRDEILDASFAARWETTTTTTRTSPSVPSIVSSAPNKLSLAHLAFRRKT